MADTVATREPGLLRPWFRRGPLANLRDDLEDLFSDWIGEHGEGWLAGRIPAMDLSETDGAVEVKLDVPGMKPEDIDIQLSGNTLTIKGERKEEKEEKGRRFHRVERRAGGFTRTAVLPCDVKDEKVDATYHDGVLTISMQKSEPAKTKKIAVKSQAVKS